MERQKTVIDASVLTKCFLSEPDSEKALRLLQEHEIGEKLIIVPELIFFEVLNAIKYNLKLTPEELSDISRALLRCQLHVEYLGELLLAKTAELAQRYNTTVYDASYAALAELHDVQCITADDKLLRKGMPRLAKF
ncbi:type II toxin-antitoxin system VapC family toxin [Candidatus Woesearchaeota archaeon]|nr:type II toxin-antitoxin system VapC family toxin [Candidatus Woesearchaeota archaeon]